MKIRKVVVLVAAALVGVVAVVVFLNRSEPVGPEPQEKAETPVVLPVTNKAAATVAMPAEKAPPAKTEEAAPEEKAAEPAAEAEPAQTEEEKREAEAEKRVEEFDALTDKWMEPSAKGVTMKDVDAFVAQFAKVPKDRKEECLQRALNLVPDENVMLLAGILMDKTQDKDLVELVFNDVLNRDEDVKKPILQQVYKDKTHPCWADTAWILDVTGEKPQ